MSLSRTLMNRPRIMRTGTKCGVPGMLMFGRYNNTSAQPGLFDHDHGRAVEICFLVKGRQTYRVEGEIFRLSGGDVFMSFPNERHSTGGLPQEKGVLYWVILHIPSNHQGFLELPKAQSRALLRSLLNIPHRQYRGSWKIKQCLDDLARLVHEPATPLRALEMLNRTQDFLLELIYCSRQSHGKVRPASMTPILQHIEQHLGEQLSVPQLAELAGLSIARFKVRFKEETGIPPGEYMQRARIEEASRRLEQGRETVTRIAYDLGFSTSQYFATVFKRFTGVTPVSRLPRRSVNSRRSQSRKPPQGPRV